LGRDWPGANARRDQWNGNGLVGCQHPGRDGDGDQHGHSRYAQHHDQRGRAVHLPLSASRLYELKVELQGFKTAEIPAFKVDVQQTVRVDVPLQVGALDETVTVTGKPPCSTHRAPRSVPSSRTRS
jgi:hypothetical protein